MSALFHARVQHVEDTNCQIRLYIIHPDQERFYVSKAFALQLLWDAGRMDSDQPSPLASEITVNQISNLDSVKRIAIQYISSVSLLEQKNFPRSVRFDEMTDETLERYWADEEGLPQAVLMIKVTNPRWIAHLTNGLEWDTTAYDA